MKMIPGVKLVLRGNPFIIPALCLADIEGFEDRLNNYKPDLSKESINLAIDLLHVALLPNYPEMTREQVKRLIDLRNIRDVVPTIMGASGIEESPPGEDQPGNG